MFNQARTNVINLTQGTSLVQAGVTSLQGIIVNSHTSGTIKVYDASTTYIGYAFPSTGTALKVTTFTFPSGSGTYAMHGITFSSGCMVVIGGTADLSIAYNS